MSGGAAGLFPGAAAGVAGIERRFSGILTGEVMSVEKLELPLGLGMALAQNEAAMKQFEALPEAEKKAFTQRAHTVRSKQEMRRLVAGLAEKNEGGGSV